MTQFKVGDWVRNTYINRVWKYTESDLKYDQENPYQNKNNEPWQPKEGEWCWFKSSIEDEYINEDSYVFAQFEYMTDRIINLGYKKEYTSVKAFTASIGLIYNNSAGLDCSYDFIHCEPFIGQLPSWIKDT